MKGVLLFNPINVVHDRQIDLFRRYLTGWEIRCIYNPAFPWFSGKSCDDGSGSFLFKSRRPPEPVFDGVRAIVVFTAQPRVEPCALIEQAILRSIPVVAIEEVHQMMLEQGYVNNYMLPVDHILAASDYEAEVLRSVGVAEKVVQTTGCSLSYKDRIHPGPEAGSGIKEKYGIPASKRVALLTLRYLTPNGETLDIRNRTIMSIAHGLPESYELVIKPHPGEQDPDIDKSITICAPRAKVAHPRMPIDDLLDVTDVLFDRGNSQVVVDALHRSVPVVIMPWGRKTCFHGIADKIIADDSAQIKDALLHIEREGMKIYKEILKKYLSISPDEAFHRTMLRIEEIAQGRELVPREDKLLLLSIIWAWMGYIPQACRTLDSIEADGAQCQDVVRSLKALISYDADQEAMKTLGAWSGRTYKRWLIQSLWIKMMYSRGRNITGHEKDWLSDFPPRMNRSYFSVYASMLYNCYMKSGMDKEAVSLANMLSDEEVFVNTISKNPLLARFDYMAKTAIRNLTWELGGA